VSASFWGDCSCECEFRHNRPERWRTALAFH
jgi:hypothetical protein